MLYELIAVVRPGNVNEVKEIARTAGSLILRSGGIIRGLRNWGIFTLPTVTRKHQAIYREGHYFIMRFDASSKIQDEVRQTLGLDPRMIKFSSVKLGNGKLESMGKIGGRILWNEGLEEREEIKYGEDTFGGMLNLRQKY